MKPTRNITIEKLKKRKTIRIFMQRLAKILFWLLTDLRIEGEDNFPDQGPLLMVGNHFSMVDIVAFVRAAPYPIEFIGGAVFANAPKFLAFLPRMWGYLPVYRGTGSHFALREAEKVLNSKGVLAIFPEGGSHGRMLRPPRPGTAFLAARTKARVLPIGLIGMDEVFSTWGKIRRPKVVIRIGEPFGPLDTPGKGKQRRAELELNGEIIMKSIADLIPEEKHGYLSDDPEIRSRVIDYPWEDKPEGDVDAMNVR
jgi:1-acyl-sn-glycerol-3-phosphate acyltransferase